MLKASLRDYTDEYILVSGTITITEERADGATKETDKRDKEIIFKSCAPFTKRIREIKNFIYTSR